MLKYKIVLAKQQEQRPILLLATLWLPETEKRLQAPKFSGF